jgi:dienelactone hydrolase
MTAVVQCQHCRGTFLAPDANPALARRCPTCGYTGPTALIGGWGAGNFAAAPTAYAPPAYAQPSYPAPPPVAPPQPAAFQQPAFQPTSYQQASFQQALSVGATAAGAGLGGARTPAPPALAWHREPLVLAALVCLAVLIVIARMAGLGSAGGVLVAAGLGGLVVLALTWQAWALRNTKTIAPGAELAGLDFGLYAALLPVVALVAAAAGAHGIQQLSFLAGRPLGFGLPYAVLAAIALAITVPVLLSARRSTTGLLPGAVLAYFLGVGIPVGLFGLSPTPLGGWSFPSGPGGLAIGGSGPGPRTSTIIFPARPPLRELESGIQTASVQLGSGRELYLYLPTGAHPPRSLPCVFIAPAGSPMFTGMALGEGDRAEHLPWVRAGFAVVAYSIDGPIPSDDPTDREMIAAFKAFRAARAGIDNGIQAIDFVEQRLPEVDPRRLYTAGHSSAGSISLLLAADDARIQGCVAFAPCVDTERHLAPAVAEFDSFFALSGLGRFSKDFNPRDHAPKIRCPIFLFTAQDDDVTPPNEVTDLNARLLSAGKTVVFSTVPSGGHYDAMIDPGLPRAIDWVRSIDAPRAGPRPPLAPVGPPVATAPNQTAGPISPNVKVPLPIEELRPGYGAPISPRIVLPRGSGFESPPSTTTTTTGSRPNEPEPVAYLEAAKTAFGEGRESAAMRYQYLASILGETAPPDLALQWAPGLERPVLAVRWGLALQVREIGATGATTTPAAGAPPTLDPYGDPTATWSIVQSERTKKLTQLQGATSGVGNQLVRELEDRIERGDFGAALNLPTEGLAKARLVTLLDTLESAPAMVASARRMNLQALVLVNVTIRRRRNEIDDTLTVSLYDVERGQNLWTSGTLSSKAVIREREAGRDIETEFFQSIYDEIAARFVLVDWPATVTAETAVKRVDLLLNGPGSGVAHPGLVAEVRAYHVRGLITAAKAEAAYVKLAGAGAAVLFGEDPAAAAAFARKRWPVRD